MIIIFLIFGLIIGSFLNAVIYRLNAVESLLDRSHCPHCKKQVRWFDNIPVISFLILSAKCRDCGEKISWQYPLVELSMGVLFALVAKYFFIFEDQSTWLLSGYYLVIFSILMIIFVYDLKYMEIPMLILWSGVIVSLAFLIASDWQNFELMLGILDLATVSGLIAGGLAFLFFFALAYYSKETWMGYGDAYLGLLAGLTVGWPSILGVLLLAFTIGAVISVGLISLSKKTMKSQVPFAPFLVVGIFLVIFLPHFFPQITSLFLLI